ncbi:MAG: formylmethanofuran dehydrogenase subunit B [Candidatus Bathyarchaeota archaeon]|nr:formylmethanofuran dehydrogenase subunit B [Candidatus Bathyarchaeota archaeon]
MPNAHKPNPTTKKTPSQIIKSVVCPICGCVCDDLEVTVENNEIVKMKNGCAVCEAKMVHGYKSERITKPLIRKNGRLVEVPMDEAVKKAAQILTDAKYPLLFGWECCTGEAQGIGVELAEELGSTLDNVCSICHGPSMMATQEAGIPGCTLGQVRHRADLIVYWGSNPWASHPRHVERYTAFPEGRFEGSGWKSYMQKVKGKASRKKMEVAAKRIIREEVLPQPQTCTVDAPPQLLNKAGRKLIVFDPIKTMTAEAADYYVAVEPNRDYEIMEVLRCLINDQEIDVDKVGGVPVDYLKEIADLMVNCEFGAIFFGLGLTASAGRFRNIELAIKMVRDLNRRTKFVIMPMRGHFNITGANVAFTWRTGYPYAIDFSQGYPQYNPGEYTTIDLLKNGDNDATLVIGSDPGAHFPKVSMQKMLQHPLIVINPDMNATSMVGDVLFPTQWCGIEYEGTVYRMDTVPIMLRKVVDAPKGILNDEQILSRILTEVRLIKAEKAKSEAAKAEPQTEKPKEKQLLEVPATRSVKRKTPN